PTHLLVAGHGGAMGTLFQNAAASRAKKYADLFPTHQIILIAVNEMDDEQNGALLGRWGFQVIAKRTRMLSAQNLASELYYSTAIASFDLYSHSNRERGAALDKDQYITPEAWELQSWRGKFTANAWAHIHGCNSGYYLAPALARLWRIPVAGSFTGTHFQRLHSTDEFYPNEKRLAPPGPFASSNVFSFSGPQACAKAGCLRMHPDPYAYWGEWGRFSHGLGFYRFFCGSVPESECELRMALSLLGYIGKVNLRAESPIQEFKSVLWEYMCPINATEDVRARCVAESERALSEGDRLYTPFLSKSLQCGHNYCWPPERHEVSTAYMDTVRSFLRGFELLRKEARSREP
ncbi:MAG: hypothetical protein AB7P49_12125, partial [Bdellovibrionales bacterium]